MRRVAFLSVLVGFVTVVSDPSTGQSPSSSTASFVSDQNDGFLPLFNASALKQWRQSGPGKFTVTDGVATGEGGMGLWWYAGRQFTNFVLRG